MDENVPSDSTPIESVEGEGIERRHGGTPPVPLQRETGGVSPVNLARRPTEDATGESVPSAPGRAPVQESARCLNFSIS